METAGPRAAVEVCMYTLEDFDHLPVTEESLAGVPAVDLDGAPIPDTLSGRTERLLRYQAKLRETWHASTYRSLSEQAFALMYQAGRVGLTMHEAAALHVHLYDRHRRKREGVRKTPYALRAWQRGWDQAVTYEAGTGDGTPITRELDEPAPGETGEEDGEYGWEGGTEVIMVADEAALIRAAERAERTARLEGQTAFQRATRTEITPPEVDLWRPGPKTRETTAEAAEVPRLLSESAEDFLSGVITPVEWAIETIWVVGNSGPIGGPEKVGKTWLAHEMVLSLATATPFLGRYRVKRPFRVLYWEEEDSRDRTKRRGRQLLAGRYRTRAQAATLRYLVGHGLKIDDRDALALLQAEIDAFRPEFVVVGNLREVHTKDENRPEMAQVRDAFRRLSRDFGCAFILIHHFRKVQEGQSKRGSQMLAGSGIWGAWAEGWIWVTPGGSDDVMLLEVGSKDAAAVGQMRVQRRDVTDGEPLAVDGDGRKVWPVILTEIERTDRGEESRTKILAAVQAYFAETGTAITVKMLEERTGLSRRTLVTRLAELQAAAAVQVTKLHKGANAYLPRAEEIEV